MPRERPHPVDHARRSPAASCGAVGYRPSAAGTPVGSACSDARATSTPSGYGSRFVATLGLLLFGVLGLAGCNPFAPALEEGDPLADLLGDPTTIEGFFTNFQNAYDLRDIALYEPLLDSNFVFLYYDFDAQVEREWGFSQELESTRRLFQNANLIQLRWNQTLSREVFDDQQRARVVRSFNLLIALESGNSFRGDGNVNFLLVRRDSTAAWKLARWRDESEF